MRATTSSLVTMWVTLLCVLLCFFFSVIDAGRYRCDYKYFADAGGYLKYTEIPANWAEARLRCHLEGGVLASPLNETFTSAMKSLLCEKGIRKKGIFTGIHAFFSRGDFHSIEGVHLSKIPHTWAKDEPDNFNDTEQCIMMLPGGELADVSCAEPRPYMCYKESDRNVLINNCGTTDPEYKLDSSTGTCYKFHTVPRTWSRAFMTCTAEGGHLAIINSHRESTVIKELFSEYPAESMVGNFMKDVASLGFQDWGEHGEFLTIHGQTLKEAGFANFLSGEPNNATTGEFCGGVFRINGLINDLLCEAKYPFICEKDPNSLLCDDDI